MILIRGRWNNISKKVLEQLKKAFPNSAIQFTPTRGTLYQLIINRTLLIQQCLLNVQQLKFIIAQFLKGKKHIKKNLRDILSKAQSRPDRPAQPILPSHRPRPQTHLNQQILNYVPRLKIRPPVPVIRTIARGLKTAMSLFSIRQITDAHDQSPRSMESSTLNDSISFSEPVLHDFSSRFSPNSTIVEITESPPLRVGTRSAQRLQFEEKERKSSLPEQECAKGQIVMEAYPSDLSQISLDEKLLAALRTDQCQGVFIDQEMLQIIPNYEQDYISKYGLKLFRKHLYESNFELLEKYTELVFSLESIKQVDHNSLKKLLVAFNESGNWYDVRLFSLNGPKVIRLDSHIPAEYFFKKTVRYERWPLLIEKALIKMLGGKQSLKQSTPHKIMTLLTGGYSCEVPLQTIQYNFQAIQAKGFSVLLRRGNKAFLLAEINNLRGKKGVVKVFTLFQNGTAFKMKGRQAMAYFSSCYKAYWQESYLRQSWKVSVAQNRTVVELSSLAKKHADRQALAIMEVFSLSFFRFEIKLFKVAEGGEYVLMEKRMCEQYTCFQLVCRQQLLLVVDCACRDSAPRQLLVSTYSPSTLDLAVDELDDVGFSVRQQYYMGMRSKGTPWRKPKVSKNRHQPRNKVSFLSDSQEH